jgi:hypothetical protein
MDSESGKIACNVCGTAWVCLLSLHVNYRYWGFGGDARNATIDKLVEHQIPDDKNS